MTNLDRTFVVASDKVLVELILRARSRLVVVAPALSHSVADAVSHRLDDLGNLDVIVILDSDPEVYRLGFGHREALDVIRAASAKNHFDLREQPGVRIGVVISDDTTIVYSPVSKNIEAGSTSAGKPNAIVLTGSSVDRIATAAGADNRDDAPNREVGDTALKPSKVHEMQRDLDENPPKPFDIARKLNVFSSKVQYVEFSVSNYRLTARQIRLPADFVDVADDDLKNRITSRIRAPFGEIGKIDIVLDENEKQEEFKVDDSWLNTERKRIEDKYTFQIKKFGRVILYRDQKGFESAANRLKVIVEKYQAALRDTLTESQEKFKKRIVDEFLPRWKQNPPEYFDRWEIEPTHEKIRIELEKLAQEIFTNAISFDPPLMKILYKNVSLENLRDNEFLDVLKAVMEKRRVPREIIDSLFESGQAAPETGRFLS